MFTRFALGLTLGVLAPRVAFAAGDGGPFSWQSDLAIWTGVVFVVLLLVLWKFAWGPIADALARREQSIAGQIREASP